MPTLRRGSLASPALRFIVLFLCAAAFTWGLQVKLSHYSNAQVHDKIVAKFDQDCRGDNEPGAKKFSVLRPTTSGAHLLSALIAAAFVVPRFAVPEILSPHGSVVASIAAFPLALSSRPPPQNA
jgi:hypothetical protein